MASLEEAITRRSPSGPTSMRPAAATSSTSTQRSVSRRQQLDDVEVVDEGVGQLHEQLRDQALAFAHHRSTPSTPDIRPQRLTPAARHRRPLPAMRCPNRPYRRLRAGRGVQSRSPQRSAPTWVGPTPDLGRYQLLSQKGTENCHEEWRWRSTCTPTTGQLGGDRWNLASTGARTGGPPQPGAERLITAVFILAPLLALAYGIVRWWGHGIGTRDLILAATPLRRRRPRRDNRVPPAAHAPELGRHPAVEDRPEHPRLDGLRRGPDRVGRRSSPAPCAVRSTGSTLIRPTDHGPGSGAISWLRWHAPCGPAAAPHPHVVETLRRGPAQGPRPRHREPPVPVWCVASLALPFAVGWRLFGWRGRRPHGSALGGWRADLPPSPCDVERQLDLSHVRPTTVRDDRQEHECRCPRRDQLGGIVAQRTPRLPSVRSPWNASPSVGFVGRAHRALRASGLGARRSTGRAWISRSGAGRRPTGRGSVAEHGRRSPDRSRPRHDRSAAAPPAPPPSPVETVVQRRASLNGT